MPLPGEKSPYEARRIARSAPRWAWDIIDETLSCDINSNAFDSALRADIKKAVDCLRVLTETQIKA